MLSMDITLIVMYVMGYIITGYPAFLIFIMAMLISVQIAEMALNSFPAEYLYFLVQSMVWAMPALALRKSPRLAIAALTMCVYEWLVAIESFVWQYITPVESPLHSQYAFIVMAIHLFILSATAKWGGEIGYTNWNSVHRSRFLRNM